MAASVSVGGVWRGADVAYVYSNGAWRDVYQMYVRNGGVWRPLLGYKWTTGEWGACSAGCGGGSQSRAVACATDRGAAVAPWKCQRFTGLVPDATQACNTHSCVECYYDDWHKVVKNMSQYAYRWGSSTPFTNSGSTTVYAYGCTFWVGGAVKLNTWHICRQC